ncbi:acyltransferase family protein [Sphingomonas sp. M1A8_2b]
MKLVNSSIIPAQVQNRDQSRYNKNIIVCNINIISHVTWGGRLSKIDKSEIFFGLDALRGYAAVSVVIFHCIDLFGMPWLFPSGGLAVDLFFTMSGFVIAHSYERPILETGWLWFMRVRLIRFMPLYVLGGALGLIRVAGLIAVGSDTPGWISAALAYFVFLPAPDTTFSAGAVSPLNGPSWSLLFELYANLGFALALPFITTRRLLTFVAAAGAMLTGLALAGQDLGGAMRADFAAGLLRSSFSIALGVTLYRFRNRLPRFTLHPIALGALAFGVFQMPSSVMWNICFVLVGSPLILLAGLATRSQNWASRFGATSSFAIYAIHQPLLSLAAGIGARADLSPALCAAAMVVVCISIAPMIDRYYDRPLRRLLHLLFRRSGPEGATIT